MTHKEMRTISLFADRVREKNPEVKIFLFGSKARGDDEPLSDIDIMVLLQEKDREIMSEIDRIAFDIELEYNVVITVIYDTEDMFNSPLGKGIPLYQAVRKEGIKI